jgi:HEAT repeat protein
MALSALTNNRDKDAVPGLMRAADIPKLRQEAIDRLALTNTPEAIRGLVECLEKYAEFRIQTMRSIAKVTNPAIVPELVKLLSSQYAPIVPVEVINALGEHRDPSAIEALARFLSRTQAKELKVPTVNALVKINHEDAIRPLYEVFKRQVNQDENLCNHILGTIRDIGGELALQVLADARLQNDPHFKRYTMAIDNCVNQVQQKLRGD